MKIIYQAEDGTTFNSEEECKKYEQEKFLAYGENGRTHDPFDMDVLVLPYKCSADAFIKFCASANAHIAGIEIGDIGTFIWDYDKNAYVKLHGPTMNALMQYVKDVFEED